jgi:predicted metal-dependent hydrolase
MDNAQPSDSMPQENGPHNAPDMPAATDPYYAFGQGVEQFNEGEFYACHDTIEALWMVADEPDRTFYQGILQVAVALYHLSNLNWRGAAILLGEGLKRLNKYDSQYGGIDVDGLITQVADLLHCLQVAGPERVEITATQLGLRLGSDHPSLAGDDCLPIAVLPRIQRLS